VAWVRIHDGAMTHPKVIGLSDKAFRLWIWGLSYSQQHLTNGAIPAAAIPARVSRATSDLLDKGLWEQLASGYQVHDYLDWNDSRDVVLKKRTEAKERMQAARDRRTTPRLADRFQESSPNVRANDQERTSHEVLRRVGLEKESLKENVTPNAIVSQALADRAARFLERYDQLYSEKCNGAKHFRRQPALDHTRAIDLCRVWDDDRLEKLAVICLTTDEDWISRTDRGFAVFAAKATWCDQQLAAWEAKQKAV
jgi:hypothetical protein